MLTTIDAPDKRSPTLALATAERQACATLARWLATPEGMAANRDAIHTWLDDHGWDRRKLTKWMDDIQAQQAIDDPANNDAKLLGARIHARMDRIAIAAEDRGDFKHAIAATESQAKLHKLGGYAPIAQQAIQINVSTATAHLASDEDLLAIANATPVDSIRTYTDPEDDELVQ